MGEQARHPGYFIVNADEMEPGTMKDRWLLEGIPHEVIEGAIISAYAVQAEVAYIFLRWSYKLSAERLARAIAEAYARHYLGENILGSAYTAGDVPARQRGALYVRRGDRPAQCAGGKTSEPAQ